MNIARSILVGFTVFIMCGVSYAGEAAAQLAGQYYDEGIKAQREGNTVAAEVAYRKFIVLAPKDLERRKIIVNNVGLIRAQQGDVDGAEEAFREALQIDPDFMPAKMNIGLIYEMRGNEIRALQYWARIFELDKMKPKKFVIADVVGDTTKEVKK